MIKILFVCHGNICRSPMAEFIMKDLVNKNNLSSRFEIASAATSTEEIGNPVYPPARKKLAEYSISCKGKTARQITISDIEYYDMIIAMDSNNVRNLRRMFGNCIEPKLSMMMDYADAKGDVADPWYTGDFERTRKDIYNGCCGLLEYLSSMDKIN